MENLDVLVEQQVMTVLKKLFSPQSKTGWDVDVSGGERIYIQDRVAGIPWYRLAGEKNLPEGIECQSYTGYIVAINTRDQAGQQFNSRKIDLVMRNDDGQLTTFVIGLLSDSSKSDWTAGAKSFVSNLMNAQSSNLVTIAPKLGDGAKKVVFIDVYLDGIKQNNGSYYDIDVPGVFEQLQDHFGGAHIALKQYDDNQEQALARQPAPTQSRSAGVEQYREAWTSVKSDRRVLDAKALVEQWVFRNYGVDRASNIPLDKQQAALNGAGKMLNELAAQKTVNDQAEFDDIPF